MDPRESRVLEYLTGFLTHKRRETMRRVVADRTRYLTVLVEDIYQPHNASAVLRSLDACGVQDVHIVENRNRYQINPGVALGSSRWLTIHRYADGASNTADAMAALRRAGYRLVATSPQPGAATLESFDVTAGPAALLLGNELDGLSAEAIEAADEHLYIDMYGFVESFNISVSAAIIIYKLGQRLRHSGVDWRLSEDARNELLLEWTRRSLKQSKALERRLWDTIES